ncbi:RNA polymerase [Amylocarpus encephaloides]|uniref:DNA-directed RNA polymerases I, II, and III subunit RPABC1 n=1 Tax=Amylocarpus encephaloides TaxID=45428 RepID=A0A9P8C7I8_9HELO|nr:RNA polymerase [Amylocarpus encephaloides]
MSTDEDRQAKQREAGSRETAKLWRAWRTVHELVQDRGYTLAEEEVKITLDDFKRAHGDSEGNISKSSMKFSALPSEAMIQRAQIPPSEREPNPQQPTVGTIWVEFIEGDNVGIKQMRNFVQFLGGHNYGTGIMVTSVNVTPSAMKIVHTQLDLKVEVFHEQDLLVNITHHELVPKHVLLSQEEKAALLVRYRLKDTQLPRIQTTDPVARYLGLRRGQVVKIIRKSETAGRYASYRFCV